MVGIEAEPGSFRDPSGRVFSKDGRIFRSVNASIAEDFDFVERSGLFADLIEKDWIIDFKKVDPSGVGPEVAQATYVLEHPRVPLISYAYEWPFSALKAAALLHLDIQIAALEKDVMLSDASAYNIQFIGTRPFFIDVLSFVRYREGEVWKGHKQFCEQFLNPLLLHAYFGISHNAWFRGALEGVAVDDIAALLPWWRKVAPRTFMHVVLQSAFQRNALKDKSAKAKRPAKEINLPKRSLQNMLAGLRNWISGIKPRKTVRTTWETYAQETSYSTEETHKKRTFVSDFVRETNAKLVWDLGCNTGEYLIAALSAGAEYGVGFDFDQGALESGFAKALKEQIPIQFLFLDATNPSPDQGWNNVERKSLTARANADAVFALALVHHLAIIRNIPLDFVVDWLVALAPKGVIEFVPKQDPMVQELLRNREDIFPDYTKDVFSKVLGECATIRRVAEVSASGRSLFWFERD